MGEASGRDGGESGAPEEPGGGRPGWTAVFILLILYTVAFLDRQVITLLVDPIKADLHITDFQVSLLQGASFVLFFTLCGLPVGWAVDRFPRRPIIFVGVIVWSIATLCGGFARNFWQLLAARSMVGAGEASLAPSTYSMLSDLFPKERLAGAMAVYSSGVAIGGALSLMIGGVVVGMVSGAGAYQLPIIGPVASWQLVFLIMGLPGLFVAGLVFLIPEPPRKGVMARAAKPKVGDLIAFMRGRAGFYAAHIAGFSLFGLMGGGFVNWIPTFLMREHGIPVAQVGLTLGVVNLVFGAAGMIGSGYIVDYLFRRGVADAHLRYYVFALLLCGAAGIGTAFAPSFPLAVVGVMMVKLIVPFIAVAASALQITTPNQYRGQVSAIFLLVYNVVGNGLGPSVTAGISDLLLGGGQLGMAIAITFAVFTPLTAICFIFGLKPMRRAVEAAEAWDGRAT